MRALALGQRDQVGGPGHRVGEIVVRAWAVVDQVLARAGGAALQLAELTDQAVGFRQHDAAGIQQWEQIAVEVALDLVGAAIIYSPLAKLLTRPLAGIAVAGNAAYPVRAGGTATDIRR